MTKLTLTIVGDSDDEALLLLMILSGQMNSDVLRTGKDAYSVSRDFGNASCDVARFEPVCASEDEITRLAEAFTEHVREYFINEQGDSELDHSYYFQQVRELNRTEPDPSICHTHDFCDANILMSNAWEETFPHEPFVPQNTFHTQLWSAAWQQAKAAEFQLPAA